ncbi:hypothetical protein VTO73DRAFT_11567 [Trametes versicolor]
MSATPTNPPPFWQPRPADFQIPAADQHNHAPPGQSGRPPPWAQPYQPKGYPPHQGSPENRRDEPRKSTPSSYGMSGLSLILYGGKITPKVHAGSMHTSKEGTATLRPRACPRVPSKAMLKIIRHVRHWAQPRNGVDPGEDEDEVQHLAHTPGESLARHHQSRPDPRAAGFKPRGDRKGPSSARSETTSQASADVDINRYLQDRPPGLPSPDRGTNGHVSGHLPQQGDAALELLALWEEPGEKWPMGADTNGGSSMRAKTGSKAQSVAEDVKRKSVGGVKSGLVGSSSVATSKDAVGQAPQARAPTPLVDTSEVPSPIASSAIPGVRDGTESSACDGSLDKDFPRSPQLEACAPQGVPADKAGLLSLSGLDSLAPVEEQIGDCTLPTARTASPTTSVSTAGGTRTSDESLADYPVLTPTPTAMSFSPVTVTAYSSRASESTLDLDDDRSYATSAASAYTPGRSVTSVERRAGPIGQQLREARIDRLEARIEVLAADLEILRLELAQLRGE